MKTKIHIEDNDVRITFSPETEIERLCILDLGDDISVSHCHKDLVLKKRRNNVRRLENHEDFEELEAEAEAAVETPAEELAQG
jgi:hypothetical protein